MQASVDLVFLCETWLQPVGDEADCAVRYMGFYGVFFFFLMLSWMFQHDYLDTYCFGLYACVLHFCICICSAQLSIFHMEKRSRNMLIIIIIIFNSCGSCSVSD